MARIAPITLFLLASSAASARACRNEMLIAGHDPRSLGLLPVDVSLAAAIVATFGALFFLKPVLELTTPRRALAASWLTTGVALLTVSYGSEALTGLRLHPQPMIVVYVVGAVVAATHLYLRARKAARVSAPLLDLDAANSRPPEVRLEETRKAA